MSGIVAIMSLDGRPIPPELPRAQLAAIAHRGEWEPRLWEAPGIALGHVNLPRTPEAEREFLPAPDSTSRYWLTWDGRLDNREELAGKLGYGAAQRAEKTDADYVLDAFVKWGDDCVHHLLGDWAVVIWDNEARRLFCAKDPIGWRQLYYAEHDGLLAVGSEPQQFFANGWLPRVPNEEYVLRLLATALQPEQAFYFHGIKELPGGTRLSSAGDAARREAYWSAPVSRPRGYRHPQEYIDEFEAVFACSLKARLRSNRPVATFLSGGLDSSYIAAVTAEYLPSAEAYTTYLASSRWMDEREYSREVAARGSIRLHEVDGKSSWYLSRYWIPDSRIDQPRVPGPGPSLLAVAAAARAAGTGVILGGEGGDEWLDGGALGASTYRCVSDALIHSRPRIAWKNARAHPAPHPTALRLCAAVLDDCLPPAFGRPLSRRLLRSRPKGLSDLVEPQSDWKSVRDRDESTAWNRSTSERHTWDVYREIVRDDVSWRDRHVFLGGKLELRSPLNDLRIVNLMAGTPDWAKRFDGRRRAILRAGLERRGLARIASRQDKGIFNELMIVGLANRESARFLDGVHAAAKLPRVRTGLVEQRLDEWLATPDIYGRDLYDLSVAGLWLRSQAALQPLTAGTHSLASLAGKEVITR